MSKIIGTDIGMVNTERAAIMRERTAESIQRGKELGAESYSIFGPTNNRPATCIASDEQKPFNGTVPMPCSDECFCSIKFHFPGLDF